MPQVRPLVKTQAQHRTHTQPHHCQILAQREEVAAFQKTWLLDFPYNFDPCVHS